MRWTLTLALLATCFAPHLRADEPKIEAKPRLVPYRLTDTQHVLVRVKINGAGPFNFIVDTGCPVLIVSTPIAKKVGLETEKGWAVLDKLEFEGGLAQTKVKARIETPFQLEGMNGMGLAGVELHGLLGYTVLAKYKMEFDFTRDKLAWKLLDFDPPAPQPIGIKGGTGGLEMMAGLMKFLTFLSGMKPAPPPVARGFLGLELEEREKTVAVSAVLDKGPAALAGLRCASCSWAAPRTARSWAAAVCRCRRCRRRSPRVIPRARNGKQSAVVYGFAFEGPLACE